MFDVGARIRVACTCGDHEEQHKREGVIVALPGFPFRDHRSVMLKGAKKQTLIPVEELRPVKVVREPQKAQLDLFTASPGEPK